MLVKYIAFVSNEPLVKKGLQFVSEVGDYKRSSIYECTEGARACCGNIVRSIQQSGIVLPDKTPLNGAAAVFISFLLLLLKQ